MLAFMFRSMSHFKFSFVCSVRTSDLHIDIQLFWHFTQWIVLSPLNCFLDFLFCPTEIGLPLCQESPCLDYRSFMVSPIIGEYTFSQFLLLFQNCFCYSRTFIFPCKFQNHLINFYRKPVGLLIGIALSSI